MDLKRPRLDRESTDHSLQTERASTDEVIAERLVGIEGDADQLIERARIEADTVLEVARETADLAGEAPSPAIVEQRLLADQLIDSERATADQQTRNEREKHARLLAALMPLERRRTDRDLFTERARSDARLANRDDFLGMVSHDLRSLLCGVLLEISSLADEATDSPEGRRTIEATQRLEQYTVRMNRLIGDLLDVVSIDTGKLTIQPRLEDGQALLSEIVEMFAPNAIEDGITLELHCDKGPLMASYDHGRMLQVLANLISNAIKFSTRGGAVILHGERSEGGLHFYVSDGGVGIPIGMEQAVFERFWQAGKDDRRGIGLGLHIAKTIVESHGGRIWVDSPSGVGSVFHVTLPAPVT